MAPEVMQDRPYSFSCDVWSLGCIMHTMLFATCPFWHDDRQERKNLVCDPSIRLDLDSNQEVGTLSSACRNFLIEVLEKDASKRPTIDQVLQHSWLW